MEISPFKAEDLPQVLAIERASHPAPWNEDHFHAELSHPERTFWVVARIEGRVAGFAGSWRIPPEVQVVNVAVDPPLRGQGVGRALLRALLSRGEAEGATLFTLEVRAGRADAVHLYESEGFRPVAIRKGFYPPDGEDAIVMMKTLRP